VSFTALAIALASSVTAAVVIAAAKQDDKQKHISAASAAKTITKHLHSPPLIDFQFWVSYVKNDVA